MRKQAFLTALIMIALLTTGCGDLLNQQKAKDKDLAKVVSDNISTSVDSRLHKDNFESFTYQDSGVYKIVVKGMQDSAMAGRFGYNAMSVLIERNNTLVQTGRDSFTINGFEGKEQIFKVEYVPGPGNEPLVTLMGRFEGETWEREKKD